MPGIALTDLRVASTTYRALSSYSDFAAVMELERQIWGSLYDEAVPIALLKVTAARGGILIGAFDENGLLIGFVYSLSSVTAGRVSQWSYKLGVRRGDRAEGVGRRLKLLQRERALEMGMDLIEWTFDPLFVGNAHLNIATLGAVAHQYFVDCHDGESLAPVMHSPVPSDGFVASWNIGDPRVARLAAASSPIDDGAALSDFEGAVAVNPARRYGDWLECRDIALDTDADRVIVEVPADFGEMVLGAPDVALAWRLATRQIFLTYFARGYRVVGFRQDRLNGTGAYLLVEHRRLV